MIGDPREEMLMPSPFPAIDPHLEKHEHWRGHHPKLSNCIQDDLQAQPPPSTFDVYSLFLRKSGPNMAIPLWYTGRDVALADGLLTKAGLR